MSSPVGPPEGAARRRAPLRGPAAFWVLAAVFATGMLGTTLPTPLYGVYQGQWHFASGVISLVFATYAVGVLAMLLFAGQSSDQVGRRPVLGVVLVCSTLSTLVFIAAPSLGWLFPARILSGLSAGLLTGAATAALTELGRGEGRRSSIVATAANMGGLALGPLVAGILAQYAPRPTVLVFEVYLGLLALAALGVLCLPETVAPRHRLSLHFHGLGIPTVGRAPFLASSLAGFSAFTVLGLFSALAPSFLHETLHQNNLAVEGAVVFLIFAVATATQVVVSRFPNQPVVLGGLGLFLVALALIVGGLAAASFGLFLTGTVVGGVAVGAVFYGSLTTANRLAPPSERGRVVSTYFLFCYLGLTIPVIAVGIAAQHLGDFGPTLVCSIVLAVLCLYAAATLRRVGAVTEPSLRPAEGAAGRPG